MTLNKPKKIIAVVQARTSSKRLSGKVLRLLDGKPMISYLLDSLKQTETLDSYILTTSSHSSDDQLVNYLNVNNEKYCRGSLNCVADRILMAAIQQNADAVVRLSGDSPLLDFRLVDKAVLLFHKHSPDLVSNVVCRTFTKGQSVEVIATRALRKICEEGLSDDENEHVTSRFYQNQNEFDIVGFEFEHPCPDIQLSIDTIFDFTLSEQLIQNMVRPHWDYTLPEILRFYRSVRDSNL